MKKRVIYIFIGTTAELIKLAPVIKELKRRKIDLKIITSGQNFVNFKELKSLTGVEAPYNALKYRPVNKSLGIYLRFSFWLIKALINNLLYFRNEFRGLDRKNTFFIVHGDTISALLGAFIAKFYSLKLIHVESGYRSFNFLEPFPEELCRYLVSHMADTLFCPNDWCLKNVRNIKATKFSTGQNTVYESCMKALKLKTSNKNLSLLSKNKFFLLIMHRQEHMLFKKKLTKMYLNYLLDYAKPNFKCVFVLHPITENFLKSEKLFEQIKKNPNIIILPRIPYAEFMKILSKCEFIATDGGSNQQEAYYFGKPCLLLRKYTEQIEGLHSNAVLAKDDTDIVKDFLINYRKKISQRVVVNPLPSKIIVDYLLKNI